MRPWMICGLILFAGCGTQPTMEQVKEKIKVQNEKLHRVASSKNADLLKEVYAADANFLAPGINPVKGRDSIIALWKNGLDDIIEMQSHSIEIGGTADIVYEVGIVETKIKSTQKDSVITHRAKYNNVWKREPDGEYRLVVDIWNAMK